MDQFAYRNSLDVFSQGISPITRMDYGNAVEAEVGQRDSD